jgi:NADH pyrophosphatase NudC (nudix superfamily)
MSKKDREMDWKSISEEALSGVKEWREAHPKATFQEIEQAVDERLNRLRARMLQDVAQSSAASDWSGVSGESSPVCPNCGGPLRKRGKHSRQLQSSRGSSIHLERQFASCLDCGYSFFPPGS